MKIKNSKGQVKYIDDSRLDYYVSQGWSADGEDKAIKLKPVKKNTVSPKPTVEEVSIEDAFEEEVSNLTNDTEGE
jgi:hypothetical protein